MTCRRRKARRPPAGRSTPRDHELGDETITPEEPFGVVLVVAGQSAVRVQVPVEHRRRHGLPPAALDQPAQAEDGVGRRRPRRRRRLRGGEPLDVSVELLDRSTPAAAAASR